VATAEGESAIQQFTRDLEGDRKRLITLAFAGLLDETNRQRSEVIQRIKALAERQRNLANLVARLTTELDQTPAPANPASPDAAPRADLAQRLTFSSRAYNELQRTMRYACDVPGQLDARLGAYARALAAGLS
jgi:anti-sigma-K factor RskA